MSVAQQCKRRRKQMRQGVKDRRANATKGIVRAPGALKSAKSQKGKK